ncbi:MAG: carbohydrate ABC transporter permease [Verrucomicrobiota bacterium]
MTESGKERGRFRRALNRQSLAGPAFALPGVLGLLLFIAVPFAMAVVLSFTNLRMGSPLPTEFVGLSQYARILEDPSFQRALINNLIFAGVVVPVQTVIALGLALLLNQQLRGRAVFRTLFFMPVVFPMALVAVVWELIYAPGPNGLMNSFLNLVSFGAAGPVDVLNHPWLALPGIMLFSLWQGVGFQMIVLLAGLQSIPGTLYEAAAVDRAGKWSQFAHVTLPQLRNPLIFTALVTTILAFRVYAQVEITTQGGPVDATTTVMYETVRTVFDRQQVGQAAAMTVVFFIMVLIVTLIQRALVKQEGEVE